MQGIDAYAVVGIAVLPGVCDVGVVDRQHLDKAHIGFCCPVNHQLQVTEVTHAQASLAAQREDGNDNTGTLPLREGESGLLQLVNHCLMTLQMTDADAAVG